MKPFPIERGIPVPRSPAKGRKVIYRFASMVKGDCFFVPYLGNPTAARKRVRSAARYHGAKIRMEERVLNSIRGLMVWKVGDVR